MRLDVAIKTLVKEVEFLGFKNLGELVNDMEQNPLAYKLSTIQAYKTYKREAFR